MSTYTTLLLFHLAPAVVTIRTACNDNFPFFSRATKICIASIARCSPVSWLSATANSDLNLVTDYIHLKISN